MPGQITFPEDYLARIRNMANATRDPSEIIERLERIAWEDNRDGLLAGTDKDGRPLARLAKSTIEHRRSAVGAASPNNPPLIPAGKQSRAIANYRVGTDIMARGSWRIVGVWENVLSKQGVPFMGYHFTGTRNRDGSVRMPKRDINGLRPEGMRKMSAALKEWLRGRLSKP